MQHVHFFTQFQREVGERCGELDDVNRRRVENFAAR